VWQPKSRRVTRHTKQAVFLSEHETRGVFVELSPTLTPSGAARLTDYEGEDANEMWGIYRFAVFPSVLNNVRLFVEEYMLNEGSRLDDRRSRTALRLPFAETGGPWNCLPTQYPWQNAAGLYLPPDILDGRSLEEHVASFREDAHVISQANSRTLKSDELAHYAALTAQLHSPI